ARESRLGVVIFDNSGELDQVFIAREEDGGFVARSAVGGIPGHGLNRGNRAARQTDPGDAGPIGLEQDDCLDRGRPAQVQARRAAERARREGGGMKATDALEERELTGVYPGDARGKNRRARQEKRGPDDPRRGLPATANELGGREPPARGGDRRGSPDKPEL